MSGQRISDLLSSIHQLFPLSVLSALGLRPIRERELPKIFAYLSDSLPPFVLPVLKEESGVVYALHLRPGLAWENLNWVMLSPGQDFSGLASAVRYLSGCLFRVHYADGDADGAWRAVVKLANSVPNAVKPDLRWFVDSRAMPDYEFHSLIDPGNERASLAKALNSCATLPEAQGTIERLAKHRKDVWTLHALAIKRAQAAEPGTVTVAQQVLKSELSMDLGYECKWFDCDCIHVPHVVWAASRILLQSSRRKAVACFETIADEVDEGGAVRALWEHARALQQRGDVAAALNVARSASALSCKRSELNAEMCQFVAGLENRVERGSLGAAVASMIAEHH